MKNRWKSLLCGVFAALFLAGAVSPASATVGNETAVLEYNNIKVTLDSASVSLVDVNGDPVEPFIIGGTTYLPIRAISNAFGLDVDWDGATQAVILTHSIAPQTGPAPTGPAPGTVGNKPATLEYSDIKVTLDDLPVNLVDVNGDPVEPFIIGGTTYLPIRALAGALGLNVSWDGATSTVILSSEKTYEVIRVVDGDTIVVNYDGVEETVRLIGVDTPESVHPDKSKNTDAGFAASEFTTVYLSGQRVALEFDVQQRDQYGRLLAYVYKNGEMFNKKLLMTGYAEIATYPPNVKYVDEFTQIVKDRDPSIPSGEYSDGYMKAPKVVYNTPESKNRMGGAFLYIDGTVKDAGTTSAGDYAIITTAHGDFLLLNVSDSNDFRSVKKGSNVSTGFLYVGYDSDLHMGYGAYMETLKADSPTTPNTSTTPTTPTSPTTPTAPTTPVESRTVYITRTGKRYHYDSNCNGGTYYESTLEEALRRGLTPCEKCAK